MEEINGELLPDHEPGHTRSDAENDRVVLESTTCVSNGLASGSIFGLDGLADCP
jgi:hypothetical protein